VQKDWLGESEYLFGRLQGWQTPISSHIILSYPKLCTPSFTLFDLSRSFWDSMWIHTIAWILTAREYYTFSPSVYTPQQRSALSYEFLVLDHERCCGVWWYALCLLALLFHHTMILSKASDAIVLVLSVPTISCHSSHLLSPWSCQRLLMLSPWSYQSPPSAVRVHTYTCHQDSGWIIRI